MYKKLTLPEMDIHPIVLACIFGGARLSCCTEHVAVYDEDDVCVGIATIAPEGEQGSGMPTIVGVWVHPLYRKQGIGTSLVENAIAMCARMGLHYKGLPCVGIDAMSKGMLAICESLIDKYPQLVFTDCTSMVNEMMLSL